MKNNVEILVDELAINNFDSESMHWVDVTHINNISNFYVRPIRYKILIRHYENLNMILKVDRNFDERKLVLYNMHWSTGGVKYIRGRIQKIYDDFDECDLFAVDYGFIERRIPFSHLKECPPDIRDTPNLAYHCLLANCFPVNHEKGWTEFSKKVFEEYLLAGRAKMTILGRTSRQLIINLMNVNLDDVATSLAIKGYTKLGPHNSCIPWKPLIVRRRLIFNFKKLQVGDSLRVRVLSGTSLDLFFVKEVNDYEKFMENITELTFYGGKGYSLLPNHLIGGTVVCAKDIEKNRYDRAFIKRVKVPGYKALLHLVDWGRDEEYTIDKIKYMPKHVISTPVTTIMCSAAEKQAWDNGYKNFLTPGFEFYIKIKTLGHEFERENLVDILPIEEVEIEEGATCLEVKNEDTKPNEPKDENISQQFEDKPFNFLDIEMEEESVEELITWIKGMGIKRSNKTARYTFQIIKKFINDCDEFSSVIKFTALPHSDATVPRKSKTTFACSNAVNEIPSTSGKSLLNTSSSGDIEDTAIEKNSERTLAECLPSTSGNQAGFLKESLLNTTSSGDIEDPAIEKNSECTLAECLPSTSGNQAGFLKESLLNTTSSGDIEDTAIEKNSECTLAECIPGTSGTTSELQFDTSSSHGEAAVPSCTNAAIDYYTSTCSSTIIEL